MVWFWYSGDVGIVWFRSSGEVKMVWFWGSSGDAGSVWFYPRETSNPPYASRVNTTSPEAYHTSPEEENPSGEVKYLELVLVGWHRWPLWHPQVKTHNSILQMLDEACTANIWTNFVFFSIDIDLLCESTGCKPGENFLICVDLKKPFKWISRSLQSCSWSTLPPGRDSNPKFASCWRQLKAPASHTPVNPLPTSKL